MENCYTVWSGGKNFQRIHAAPLTNLNINILLKQQYQKCSNWSVTNGRAVHLHVTGQLSRLFAVCFKGSYRSPNASRLLICIRCPLSRAHSQYKLVIPSQFLNNPLISPRISRTKGRETSSLNHPLVSVPAVRHCLHLQVAQIIIMLLETQRVLRTQRRDFKNLLCHRVFSFSSAQFTVPAHNQFKGQKRNGNTHSNLSILVRSLSTYGRHMEGGERCTL